MGVTRGINIVREKLMFGYDTGYGVSNNATSTRFYPGEPTTNATPLTDFFNLSNWTGGGWSGSAAYSTIYNNALEFTVTNGWRTFAIDHGITSGGTVSVSFEYRLKSQQTDGIFGLVLNGLNLGNYHNNLGNISNADLEDSFATGWKRYTGTFTANNNTYGSKLAIGLRGTDNGGLTDVLIIRKLQVELKGHSTPYTETSRSNTQGLIDLARKTDINLSNVSFNSTSLPEFDGTDDYFTTSGLDNYGGSKLTFDFVIKFNGTLDNNDRKVFHWDKTGSTNAVAQVRKGINNGRLLYQHHNSQWYSLSVDNVVTANEYIHITVVHDGTTATMYKNGVQVGTTTVGALSYSSAAEILVGYSCLLYTSPSPRDKRQSRMPSSA